MQQTTPQPKKLNPVASTVEPGASVSPNGVALAPPVYGLAVVDNQRNEPLPTPSPAYQAHAAIVWPEGAGTIQRKTTAPDPENNANARTQENKTGLPDQVK